MRAAHSVVPATPPILALDREAQAHPPPGGRCAATYWPAETLNIFMLRMAAAGHCVNAAMMLGDRGYAVQQLTVALALQDQALRDLASELRGYFQC